ncbi:ATP synthase subunit I [uncultured Subdoligranulum sp.]|uniref:ATP synthase subunit I n=1 Tax=uncultured Subdoligranulum sp. TaxID=512298 RepID=UPI00260169C7|nr:ATP synthase subunit I [uncultured Subdoligranulum sp.]
MQKHREILRQVCRLMVALAVCVAIMLGVYALLGAFTSSVVVGAILGFVLAVGNFVSLSITVSNAMDRAARDKDPQRAQLSIQASGVIRLLVLAAIYILLFRAKVCDPVAALLPLLMAQAVLKLVEFFRKDDEGGDATV